MNKYFGAAHFDYTHDVDGDFHVTLSYRRNGRKIMLRALLADYPGAPVIACDLDLIGGKVNKIALPPYILGDIASPQGRQNGFAIGLRDAIRGFTSKCDADRLRDTIRQLDQEAEKRRKGEDPSTVRPALTIDKEEISLFEAAVNIMASELEKPLPIRGSNAPSHEQRIGSRLRALVVDRHIQI